MAARVARGPRLARSAHVEETDGRAAGEELRDGLGTMFQETLLAALGQSQHYRRTLARRHQQHQWYDNIRLHFQRQPLDGHAPQRLLFRLADLRISFWLHIAQQSRPVLTQLFALLLWAEIRPATPRVGG